MRFIVYKNLSVTLRRAARSPSRQLGHRAVAPARAEVVPRDEARRHPVPAGRAGTLQGAQFVARAQDAQRVQRPWQHRHAEAQHGAHDLERGWTEGQNLTQNDSVNFEFQ